MTIKIVLADDHPVVRSGIRNELARHPDFEVLGEAVNGDEALRLVETLQPDVLLLDLSMPGCKTAQVVRELQAQPHPPYILILTAYGDPENVLGILKAGVAGYLLKDEVPEVIADGVRAVAQGKNWLSATVAETIVRHAVREEAQPVEEVLSARELAVLRLLARGYNNAQIAEALAITEGTVKNHVTNVYTKLGVHSRTEAVVWAWQHGLVSEVE